ncbi:uncharacterized protein LOC119719296 [Patiria miniata]|uniref:Uncharacterized protein n=1 Tax=Patiria miniata TaxID=46514 RepID=A0A913Z1R6_PATMI|nr:uncharacterized protein LOC119719296 [Patiria miniata]XP_038044631.1 uncharacterized protein LOC119719296 [Patiria miniata]XP_038044632.1 uncharacterized protein LOC119719296 [Patiria miniata]
MRRIKLTNLLICGIATFLFGATYLAFKEPPKERTAPASERGLGGKVPDLSGNSAVKSRQPLGDDDDALLLPFADRALPRRLLQVPSYMRMLNASTEGIDIDIAWGDIDFHNLDLKTVIVTGLSGYTEEEGVGLVASAQIHMPFKKIIIYDLGVKQRTLDRLSPLCNVEIRKFDYTKYPAHVKILRNNAWKLVVITEALEEFGSVFYAHPHLRFRAPISILFPYVKQMHGFIPSMNDDTPLLEVTHPTTLRLMQVKPAQLNRTRGPGGSRGPGVISGHMLLFVMNSTLANRVLPGLRKCYLRSKCLSPPGAMWQLQRPGKKLHRHHFDQAVLSLMMYKLYGVSWQPREEVQRMMKRLFVVLDEGDPVHELSWSFRCNPPKEEFDPAKLLQKKL